MTNTRHFPLLVTLVALLVVAVALALGWRLIRGDSALLRGVAVGAAQITPNADGDSDVAEIRYELSRNAVVSIYFEDGAGERYYFRREQSRGSGEYAVLFSGVVDGYLLPGESFDGEVLARLLQDGDYTWVVEATDERGLTEQASGTLAVAQADPQLPEIRAFSLTRDYFTPNQDGISDRVQLEFFLPKDVETVRVYLEMPDGAEVPISERPGAVLPNKEGRHVYDWGGGVDQKAAPPPDGTYTVVAYASDHEGQKFRVTDRLTLALGGIPYANIISPVEGDTLAFNTTSVSLCDTLSFTVTVRNYGEAPLRTVGPWSGAVYDSDWNYNTMAWPTEAGAWRLGIGYENALGDYPYRWGLGTPENLTRIDDHYYLMPGEQVVVTGGIRVVDPFGVRNPQPVWAGLIHEDVEIADVNRRVDTHMIQVDLPAGVEVDPCEQRPAPVEQQSSR